MPKKNSPRTTLTPREQKDLDIEIGFIEGLVRKDPRHVEALQILGDDYTRRGRLHDGLRVDESLALIRPDDALVHYNLACSYSLTEKIEPGLKALEQSLALGYRDFKWLNRDPDLENLRQHPHYRQIRAKIRSLKVKVR